MCGICAILDDRGIEEHFEHSDAWSRCMASLKRRGPDGHGTWIAPSRKAILGHTRLAIVDPTQSGHQPMHARAGTLCITYNGELYNAPELRARLESHGYQFRSRCDTEVLLNAWLCWGKGMLDQLLGMFAFGVWDDTTRTLFAGVDHAGIKPMVWKFEGDRLYLASDADSLRALTARSERLNPQAVRHVLTLGCCPAPMTMWSGISKLCPGHTLEWSAGSAPIITRYYTPPDQISDRPAPAGDAFDALFEQVIADHLIADVHVGAFLSGGVDSAAVSIAATRMGATPSCFTLEMEGDANELDDATRVANRLGLSTTSGQMSPQLDDDLDLFTHAFDEPQGFSALLTMVRIAKLASGQLRSLIAGDGGDETFGGYLWQRENAQDAWQNWHRDPKLIALQSEIGAQVARQDADDQTRALARRILGSHSFVHGYLSRVFPGFHPAESVAMTPGWSDPYDETNVSDWLIGEDRPELEHLRRVQRLDLLGFCPASILPKLDRGAMHFGLEVRSPMLDRRLIDLGLTARVDPNEMIADGSMSRPYLRRYCSKHLGDAFSHRPKQGFSIRSPGELHQWRGLAEKINTMKIVRQGILDPSWRNYVPFGDMTRLRLVCMLGAWAQERI